jgi:hypothetical protein
MSVNANTPDVGLILLDPGQEFQLDHFPSVQRTQLPDRTEAFNIGRKRSGQLSNRDLYVGHTLTLEASRYFRFSYQSAEVIEPGDSGGPVLLPGTHTIVAVNSGAGSGSQVLARTDAVISDIEAQVAANGGWGASDPGEVPGEGGATGEPIGTGGTGGDPNSGTGSSGNESSGGSGDPGNPASGGTGSGGWGSGGSGSGGWGDGSTPVCRDRSWVCGFLAAWGECSRHATWMQSVCCSSCGGGTK